jgi:uncharacterized protein (TIGR02246 family)
MNARRFRFASFLIACAVLGPVAFGASRTESSSEIAAKAVEQLTAAYRARDGHAYAALFWPDAELMNVFGQVVTGQDQIEALVNTVFRGPLRDRVVHMDIRKIRQLAPNVIVLDTTNSDASKSSDQVTQMKWILEKRGLEWRVIAGQNTAIQTPAFETGLRQ